MEGTQFLFLVSNNDIEYAKQFYANLRDELSGFELDGCSLNLEMTGGALHTKNNLTSSQTMLSYLLSALEKAKDEGEMTDAPLTEVEFELAKTLSIFPERIKSAIADYEPSVVTRYILDLSAAFNRFYHECKIVACEDEAQRASRIALTKAANRVLKTALGLICMQTPEKI